MTLSTLLFALVSWFKNLLLSPVSPIFDKLEVRQKKGALCADSNLGRALDLIEDCSILDIVPTSIALHCQKNIYIFYLTLDILPAAGESVCHKHKCNYFFQEIKNKNKKVNFVE
jgi:hypothetical protein